MEDSSSSSRRFDVKERESAWQCHVCKVWCWKCSNRPKPHATRRHKYQVAQSQTPSVHEGSNASCCPLSSRQRIYQRRCWLVRLGRWRLAEASEAGTWAPGLRGGQAREPVGAWGGRGVLGCWWVASCARPQLPRKGCRSAEAGLLEARASIATPPPDVPVAVKCAQRCAGLGHGGRHQQGGRSCSLLSFRASVNAGGLPERRLRRPDWAPRAAKLDGQHSGAGSLRSTRRKNAVRDGSCWHAARETLLRADCSAWSCWTRRRREAEAWCLRHGCTSFIAHAKTSLLGNPIAGVGIFVPTFIGVISIDGPLAALLKCSCCRTGVGVLGGMGSACARRAGNACAGLEESCNRTFPHRWGLEPESSGYCGVWLARFDCRQGVRFGGGGHLLVGHGQLEQQRHFSAAVARAMALVEHVTGEAPSSTSPQQCKCALRPGHIKLSHLGRLADSRSGLPLAVQGSTTLSSQIS